MPELRVPTRSLSIAWYLPSISPTYDWNLSTSSGVRITGASVSVPSCSTSLSVSADLRNEWNPAHSTSVPSKKSAEACSTRGRSQAIRSMYPWRSPVAPPMKTTESSPTEPMMDLSAASRKSSMRDTRSSPSKESNGNTRNPATAPSAWSMSTSES